MAILKVVSWLLLLCVGTGVIIGTAYAALIVAPFLIGLALLSIVVFTIGTLIAEAEEEKKNKD